ncbi:carbonic anhydrase 2-like isoform X1 [Branchiostoma floridae x Branchiostoma japonicum]
MSSAKKRGNIYLSGAGPSAWHEDYPVAKGKRQSPVDINTNKTKFDPKLAADPLTIRFSDSCCQSIVNTGISFQVTSNGAGCELSGGPLDSTYQFAQFHAHWGAYLKTTGSEHTVDGVSYPAELHLVHWNTKYDDFKDAVDKPDGLAVIAVFFKRGKEHPGFGKIQDLFSKIPAKGAKVNIDFEFNPGLLMPPDSENYWTYLGSLTTPPLYESVTWIVMKEALEVSVEQIAILRTLLWETPNGVSQMYNNFRPPVPLRDRVIRASFGGRSAAGAMMVAVPAWAWGAVVVGLGAVTYTLSNMSL